MYSNTTEEIRPDLMEVVSEASAIDYGFIGDQVMPPHFVRSVSGDYTMIKAEETGLRANKNESIKRAPRTAYPKTDRTTGKDTYLCEDWGFEEEIDDTDQAKAAPTFDMEAFSTKACLAKLRRHYESRVADVVFDESKFTPTDAGVPYETTNITTFDFAADVEAAQNRMKMRGELYNALVLSKPLWDRVRMSELLSTRIYGSDKKGIRVKLEDFKMEFGFEHVLISEAAMDVSQNKNKQDVRYIFPATHFSVCQVGAGPLSNGGFGRTLVWEELADQLFVVETYRKPIIKSDCVRVRQYTDEKVVNVKAAELVKTNFA